MGSYEYGAQLDSSALNGSYTMMAKPMKALELHYLMLQSRGQFNKEITLAVFTRVIDTCKVRLVNTRIL